MHRSLVVATTIVTALARSLLELRPSGLAREEVARVVRQGYAAGELCEVAFTAWFLDPQASAPAAIALERAGYVLARGPSSYGFLRIHHRVRLRPASLARVLAQLERVVAAHGGFVDVVGAVSPHAPGGVRHVA